MFTFFLKEIRQLRRDPVFWGTLGVQIMLGALIIAIKKLSEAGGEGAFFSHGYDNLGILAAMIVAIAMSTRWHNEMNDDALNPVVTTPLAPWEIVAGKYLATLLAVLIPLAVAQIFIASTIPHSLFDLYLKFRLPMNMAILATVSAVLLTVSPVRCKSAFVCSVLPGMFLLFVLISFWLPQLILMAVAEGANEVTRCPGMIYLVLKILLPIPLLFALTIAAISAVSSDRAIPVRIMLLFTLAGYLGVFCFETREFTSLEFAHKAAELCGCGAFLSALAAVAERRAQSSRVLAAIRRTPAVLRPLRLVCSTGALQEIIFSLVLMAAALILQKAAGESFADRKIDVVYRQLYVQLIFCAAATIAVTGIVQMAFRRRIMPWLRYVIFYAVNFVLTVVLSVIHITESDGRAYLIVLGVLSAAMLIPTAMELVKSLKRE